MSDGREYDEERSDDDQDVEPYDRYDEYSEWLMKNYMICNGDDLVRHLERGDGFDDFLRETRK